MSHAENNPLLKSSKILGAMKATKRIKQTMFTKLLPVLRYTYMALAHVSPLFSLKHSR